MKKTLQVCKNIYYQDMAGTYIYSLNSYSLINWHGLCMCRMQEWKVLIIRLKLLVVFPWGTDSVEKHFFFFPLVVSILLSTSFDSYILHELILLLFSTLLFNLAHSRVTEMAAFTLKELKTIHTLSLSLSLSRAGKFLVEYHWTWPAQLLIVTFYV